MSSSRCWALTLRFKIIINTYTKLYIIILLSNFFHIFVSISKEYVSPVIMYFPVSPVAPPNKIALFFEIRVIVCPNLANGRFPYASTFSIFK